MVEVYLDPSKELIWIEKSMTYEEAKRRGEHSKPPKVGTIIVLSSEGWWTRAKNYSEATTRAIQMGITVKASKIKIFKLAVPIKVLRIRDSDRYHW
jgi:hypothetical protein